MLTEMIIKMMPEFASAVSEPISKVESIRILDGGSGKQVNSLPQAVTNTMVNLQESLAQMTGIDLNEILNRISGMNQPDAASALNDIQKAIEAEEPDAKNEDAE